jgi:hypothetical protein
VSLSVAYQSKARITETLEGVFVDPADATVAFNGLDESGTLTGATTPPVTKHSEGELTLSSGTGSINLVALPGKTAEETVVGTGLKVQVLKLRNKSTNANKITVTKGASNGYSLNAAGDAWTVVLDPGQSALFLLDDAAPDVASGARLLDVTGTGAQVLEFEIVLG